MSRRSVNWQQAQARRYGAQIPQARARVQRVTIRPVQLGPAPSPLTPGARARYELHEGILSMIQDAMRAQNDAHQSQQVAAAGFHAGLSIEHTTEQFVALMEYIQLVELVSDRLDRIIHVDHIRNMLRENERILQRLDQAAMGDSSLPSSRDLQAVIISRETAERALGRIDTIRAIPDRWSQRPWIWESQFWDTEYNQEQQRLRDRDRASATTGVVVPQPVMLRSQHDIQRVVSMMGCAVH